MKNTGYYKSIYKSISMPSNNSSISFFVYKTIISPFCITVSPCGIIILFFRLMTMISVCLEISSDFVLYNETNDNRYKCDCNSSAADEASLISSTKAD